jgi:hypothetical protein
LKISQPTINPKTDIHCREKAQKAQNEGLVVIQHGRFHTKQGRFISLVFAPSAPLCGYSTSEFGINHTRG